MNLIPSVSKAALSTAAPSRLLEQPVTQEHSLSKARAVVGVARVTRLRKRLPTALRSQVRRMRRTLRIVKEIFQLIKSINVHMYPGMLKPDRHTAERYKRVRKVVASFIKFCYTRSRTFIRDRNRSLGQVKLSVDHSFPAGLRYVQRTPSAVPDVSGVAREGRRRLAPGAIHSERLSNIKYCIHLPGMFSNAPVRVRDQSLEQTDARRPTLGAGNNGAAGETHGGAVNTFALNAKRFISLPARAKL
ncbi:hypothetical protein EVAR_85690_1 [Eumeta japonica]|uniref:Uncharacterized protein n=1 Tax=Eumeta variegata TaxID=151549 RepID=A0A4C1WD74_EUMVA|nr:hypothetical protein EVAR_85690_1 [Eumeta japonica]